jgi:hypothetical protein
VGLEYEVNNYLTSIIQFQYQQFQLDKNKFTSQFAEGYENYFFSNLDSSLIFFNNEGFDVQKGAVDIFTVSLNVKGQYPLPYITPYAAAGGGYMHMKQEVIDINYYDEPLSFVPPQQATITFFDRIPGRTADALLANLGIGIYYNKWNTIHPFVEGQYNLGFTKKVDLFPNKPGDQESFDTIYYSLKFGLIFNLK